MNQPTSVSIKEFNDLRKKFRGEVLTDLSSRYMYATDASIYRELPTAIVKPADKEDIRELIRFARTHNCSVIPRTAGTSLAGQVVGTGIVADVSRYMNRILEVNARERWVRVEPGVVLDELNLHLAPYGLFFAPETSTSNRCMIGGMVGNNSCGAHSLIYGSTRDHVIEIETLLSDSSEAVFRRLNRKEFDEKCREQSLEGSVYRNIREILSNAGHRNRIENEYPDPLLHRRNTGYALDLLMNTAPFKEGGESFNFCRLLTGSEGTLAFSTAIKLNLLPLPPTSTGLLCVHFHSLEEALRANLIALKHAPGAIELMDDVILKITKDNRSQQHNRFFVEGDPAAILVIEWARDRQEEIRHLAGCVEMEMRAAGLGYHFPLIFGPDQKKVWNLRKAGLGVLTNIPGDAKPTGLIEDTAVIPALLPDYIAEFKQMLSAHGLSCVYYAHIATGELHLKPVLNLRQPHDYGLFSKVAEETALLVKKYRGSLSGEHGDGRLRGPFIRLMLGEEIYQLFCDLKKVWDPDQIFNPGKITATPPMNEHLRYMPGHPKPKINTLFDFSKNEGWLGAIEQCNGSADCRKSALIGGTMCPSYMATHEESHTTRARTNILREFLTPSDTKSRLTEEEVYDILDPCLSCKGCKSECPSGIDITKYKAEFLQWYYDVKGVPFRARVIAGMNRTYRLFTIWPGLFNFFTKYRIFSYPLQKILGFSTHRPLPALSATTLRSWYRKNPGNGKGRVIYLFADEFTNLTEVETGIKTIRLLRSLGYNPVIPMHDESGRTYLSKGFLRKARTIAESNIINLMLTVGEEHPLIGIEPGAILCFRDEYPELVHEEYRETAKELAAHCYTIEEFISDEFQKGRIDRSLFTQNHCNIKFHGHCYQKALTTTKPVRIMLEIPEHYQAEEIRSGCCGMAGSFGYEHEHYDLSMKVGELVLFPAVRESEPDTVIAASGTSCRQHIGHGTGRRAIHPAEVLFDALKEEYLVD